MSNVPPVYQGEIQTQEVQFKAGVSEYTAGRVASNLNALRNKQIPYHSFKMNGSLFSANGLSGVDGIFTFPFDAELFQVFMYLETPGTSGSLTLDLKRSPSNTNTFTSIFSTQPVITSSAAASTTISIGSTVTGTTAPVLTASPIVINQFDQIKMDVISMQTGLPKNAGIQIFYRMR